MCWIVGFGWHCHGLGTQSHVGALGAAQALGKDVRLGAALGVQRGRFDGRCHCVMEEARLRAGRYQYQYQEPIPVEQLVEFVCNYKQYYTQRGGLRPFGVAFLFAGYDRHYGFQLYQSDPSGNYSGWKATVIGANNQAGKSIRKSDYETTPAEAMEGTAAEPQIPDIQAALKLAVKVLNKTMDGTGAAAAEKMELFTMTLDENQNVVHRILNKAETQAVVESVEQEAASAGDS